MFFFEITPGESRCLFCCIPAHGPGRSFFLNSRLGALLFVFLEFTPLGWCFCKKITPAQRRELKKRSGAARREFKRKNALAHRQECNKTGTGTFRRDLKKNNSTEIPQA